MSKNYLVAEKTLINVQDGLERLMILHGKCAKAMESKDPEEHNGVAIVSSILLKNITKCLAEVSAVIGGSNADTTTTKD